jgi:hypothetical protein
VNNEAYFLDEIKEILETAFYTASLRDTVPISMILVADSGTAKSKLILSISTLPGVHKTDSFSSKGLFDLMAADVEKKIRFITTPDLNPTLSRKASTVEATVANLLSVTADGTCRVDDARGEKVCKHGAIGLLSACTPSIYHGQAKKWFALGLRRRIIPVFFTYRTSTLDALMKLTRGGKINGGDFQDMKLKVPVEKQMPLISDNQMLEIEIKSRDFAHNLGKLSIREDKIKKWVVQKVIPISPFVTLQSMARAHALRANRTAINKTDIDFISHFVEFTNPEEPRQI